MEEKKHDDRLDAYVRHSFHAYEEDPAPVLWARIEAELLPPAPLRLPLFRRYRWTGCAAVILILAALAGEHYSLKYKTGRLESAGVEKPAGLPETTAATAQALQNTFVVGAPVSSPGLPAEEAPAPARSGKRNNPNGLAGSVKTAAPRTVKNLPARQSPNPKGRAPEAPIPVSTARATSEAQLPSAPGSSQSVSSPQFDAPAFLPVVMAPLTATRAVPASRVPSPVEPVRTLSGWYAGLQVRPQVRYDASVIPVRRPGGRPVYVSRQEAPEVAADYWIKAGKRLGSRFVLESGVGYSAWKRTTIHTPRFRFAEGMAGGNPHRRNFTYDLSTYGGSAEVSLRMEQVDSDPVADDEPVSLQIRISEQAQILRIPLLVGYRLGNGRLHGLIKAGLTGNYLLRSELSIVTRISRNTRFQPAQGNDSHRIQPSPQNRFFPGYWLSAGAAYRLTRNISLVAEPSLQGDFPRNDRAGRRLPGQFSPGIQTGLNYYF